MKRKRWDLQEVIMVSSALLLPEDTQMVQSMKNVPSSDPGPVIPYLGLLSLHNCEKSISVLNKLPSLWYFVIVAKMDYGTSPCFIFLHSIVFNR
jgi:hypothetical protein